MSAQPRASTGWLPRCRAIPRREEAPLGRGARRWARTDAHGYFSRHSNTPSQGTQGPISPFWSAVRQVDPLVSDPLGSIFVGIWSRKHTSASEPFEPKGSGPEMRKRTSAQQSVPPDQAAANGSGGGKLPVGKETSRIPLRSFSAASRNAATNQA
jgi:hypothetical protein